MSEENLKSEFSRLQNVCYLDYAGAGLYSESQIEEICTSLKTTLFGNPHSLNQSGRYCHDVVDQIRSRVLQYFNTDEDEYSLMFTSGATSGLKSIAEWFNCGSTNNDKPVGHFVYLRDNHTSVLGLREIFAERQVQIHCLEHEEAFIRFEEARICECKNENHGVLGNGLFVYPAMCNFSGCKYPLSWMEKLRTTGVLDYFVMDTHTSKINHRWYSLLDAAAYVPTNKLNLSEVGADFVVISFYKMFGFPTGLGGLFVKKSTESVLMKSYFGGGTVLMAISNERKHIRRPTLHEWCEDGTINYLSILSLKQGFDALQRLGGGIESISEKVFRLTKKLFDELIKLHHSNGQPVVRVYADTDYCDPKTQGGIVNFNLMRSDGSYVGYVEVLHVANSYDIHLRTGCFCNPGACQRHLQLTNKQLLDNFDKGHTCANNVDLINGQPTGSVRASFGYVSSEADVDYLVRMIIECFIAQPVIINMPQNWLKESQILKKKFYNPNSIHESNSKITSAKFECRNARLKAIFVYPIKSCGSFKVHESWPLTDKGLKYDREWMIVTQDHVVLTQKQIPRMCLITPVIDEDKGIMSLTFPSNKENSSINVSLEHNSSIPSLMVHQSKICRDRVQVVDCGDDIASWLESLLEKSGIRLVRLLTRNQNKCASPFALSLANEAQYLLITEPSVKWLQRKILDGSNFEMKDISERFRSNFIIDGEFNALDELQWDRIRLGSFLFRIEGPCTRCQMICIDQSSGKRNRRPLIALSTALQGRIQFGIYLKLENVGLTSTLNINEEVVPIVENKE